MDVLDIYTAINPLKTIKRAGWLKLDLDDVESIADHTLGVSLLALLVPLPKDIDRDHLVRMAVVHDVAEAEVGDIQWEKAQMQDLQKRDEKDRKEKEVVLRLFSDHPDLLELAVESLELQTPTSKFLKELDRLEMALQALVYENDLLPEQLDEWWQNADHYIQSPQIRPLFEKALKKRAINV